MGLEVEEILGIVAEIKEKLLENRKNTYNIEDER